MAVVSHTVLHRSAEPSRPLATVNNPGWVGYLRGGALLVRRFEPATGQRHPDLGCNVETYCSDRFLELELLGPLAEVAPGASVVLTERWQVLRVASDGIVEALESIANAPV